MLLVGQEQERESRVYTVVTVIVMVKGEEGCVAGWSNAPGHGGGNKSLYDSRR